jgi:hypothetical protein
MNIDESIIESYYEALDSESKKALDISIQKIIVAKRSGGKVVVATGSGPNLHEGVTTLIAHLIKKGVVDGVTTSSAVVSHEMAGVLDKVKRIAAFEIGSDLLDFSKMPRGDIFELSILDPDEWKAIRKEMIIDEELVRRCQAATAPIIIKAAGNMAYPMGLRTEKLAESILSYAHACGQPFEVVAGWGCDERTMLGAGAKYNVPILVSIPQLVGGGHVGIAIGDSISISERSARIARMLGDADVIIESAVVLTQEIHDGPYETYTGHGIWANWNGFNTYSLRDRTLIRFDLDENLRKAWELDKKGGDIQTAINQGLPKTKMSKIPFRMEMSAFSRLESSIPVIGDIGIIWPVLAYKVCKELGIELEFMSHPQQTADGKSMREFIVKEIKALDYPMMKEKSQNYIHKN